jgi:5,10-methylenetetrahydromethanopterin reductase
LELWRAGGSNTTATAEEARAVEAEGWDGQMFMDSQCLSADPFVQMGVWAAATERLRLATGTSNPYTRHLAVVATCAATVQSISGGRAVLGIGRGDSALAYLGRGPVGLREFERALHELQALLRGEQIPFEDSTSLEELPLAGRPEGISLRWLPEGLPKVPLDVNATGPKVITMAALVAERVTFSVGAIPERIEWALGVAREARAAQGLTDDGVSYGAQLVVVCNTDADAALELATTMCAPLARFQVIHGQTAGPLSEDDAANYEVIRKGYDMTKHTAGHDDTRLVGGRLTPEFVRRFAIVGSPDEVTERLLDLAGRGLERFYVVGPGFYPQAWGEARSLFAREVIPALRNQEEDT